MCTKSFFRAAFIVLNSSHDGAVVEFKNSCAPKFLLGRIRTLQVAGFGNQIFEMLAFLGIAQKLNRQDNFCSMSRMFCAFRIPVLSVRLPRRAAYELQRLNSTFPRLLQGVVILEEEPASFITTNSSHFSGRRSWQTKPGQKFVWKI